MSGWRPAYVWNRPGQSINGGIVLSNGNVAVLTSTHPPYFNEDGAAPIRVWSTIFAPSGNTYLPISDHLLIDTTGTAVTGSPTGVWQIDPYPVTLLSSGLVLIAWNNLFGDGDTTTYYGIAPAILSADGTSLVTDILDDPFYGFTAVAGCDDRVVAYEYKATFVSSFVDDYTDVFHDLGPGATMSKTPLHSLTYGLVFTGDGSGAFKTMHSLSGAKGTMLAVGGEDDASVRFKMVSVAADGTLSGLVSTTTTAWPFFGFLTAGNAPYSDHIVNRSDPAHLYPDPVALSIVAGDGSYTNVFSHVTPEDFFPFREGAVWTDPGTSVGPLGFPGFQRIDGSADVGGQSFSDYYGELSRTIGFGRGNIGFLIGTAGGMDSVVFVHLPELQGAVTPGRIRFV